MKRTDDGYELSTGRKLSAGVPMMGPNYPEPRCGEPWLNEAERREIAEYMVRPWRDWGGGGATGATDIQPEGLGPQVEPKVDYCLSPPEALRRMLQKIAHMRFERYRPLNRPKPLPISDETKR